MTAALFHEILVNDSGTLLYGAVEKTVQLYDTNTGKLISSYTYPEDVIKPKSNQTPAPKHIHTLRLSRNQKYLIGTVNEGKYVLVFDASNLELVTKRSFPKRPSAVDTTVDSETLIVGDKFGDVYSVPLTGTDELVQADTEESKIEPILGHVSMLVDLAVAEKYDHQYIITADRDEHVRVTRFPQSYVIERWLFGHTEFVSAIATLPWSSSLLVTAGGDDFLALWDWTSGELLQKIDLRFLLEEHLNESHNSIKEKNSEKREITISQIITIEHSRAVLVLCENTKCVIQLSQRVDNSLSHQATYVIDKPIISISASVKGALYISAEDNQAPLRFAQCTHEGITETTKDFALSLPESTHPVALYNIKHLRKRGEF